MTRERFKMIHSDLIMEVQCMENDLRVIYAAMKSGDFKENIDDLETASLGTIIKELRKLDYSDGCADLSQADYEFIDQIREIRNYWCHQCYLDYVYLPDPEEQEKKFQEIAERLRCDENCTWQLQKKVEKLRSEKLKEYRKTE